MERPQFALVARARSRLEGVGLLGSLRIFTSKTSLFVANVANGFEVSVNAVKLPCASMV